MKLRCFDSISRDDLLQLEEDNAKASSRTPLQSLLSTDPDRLLAGDNGIIANPHYTDHTTQLNPITCALTRDKGIEPRQQNTQAYWEHSPNATSSTGEPFKVVAEQHELAGATAAADKNLAMVMLAVQHTIGRIDLVRFTDGALFPDPNEHGKALHVGWGMVRGATQRGTPIDGMSRYTGNALSRLATIGRAELTAVVHAMLDLQTYSNYRLEQTQDGTANMIICMDSDSCAQEMESTLRAGDHESLTKCDDAQLIETIDNLRADLHHRGCKMILVKVPGHAREEFGIEANTQQAYADATAKAAAHLTTHVDPPLTVKRGPHILAAQEDPNHTGTDPNTGFSTIGTGTRTSKWVARGVQSTLTLKAIRRDDATHDATTGRSAIDRIITGADPKLAPAPSSQPKALPLHPTARHPACTAQTHSPTPPPPPCASTYPPTHACGAS